MNDHSKSAMQQMANAIRFLSIDAVEQAKSGHPGMPMGMADVATVLFSKFLTFYKDKPEWPNRDKFVLSAGHGSMLLYSILHLTGYDGLADIEEIKKFRQLGSKTAGHPEYGLLQGVDATTGPLGQGFANAVGMALAERILNSKFGNDIINHRTYAIAGDGCLMEGITHEAASLAGHLKLNKLIVFFDNNKISIDGATDLAISDDYKLRFMSYNWNFYTVDGHDFTSIEDAIRNAHNSDKPSLICCNTIIGKGAKHKAGKASSHGAPLGAEEVQNARESLQWQNAPFEIPDNIMKQWREIGIQNKSKFEIWQKNLENHKDKTEIIRMLNGELPTDLEMHLRSVKQKYYEQASQNSEMPIESTRKSSGYVIAELAKHIPELIGGSADLTESNCTRAKAMQEINCNNFSGNYIHYGIREHAMASIMNGMSLHGGILPYGGSFLVFTDYMRPAIRLSALMRKRVIYVMTHDSIGLGEDGPTHQPVEHLASLRAIPNLHVFRPADKVEVMESWQKMIELNDPSILSLTRQNVANARKHYVDKNLSAMGFYILQESTSQLKVTIFSSGSEVEIALKTQMMLEKNNIGTRVISTPCWELFEKQDSEYKDALLNNHSIKVAIEASLQFGWERYIGNDGIFIGMNDFGASAPAKDLYRHFGIYPERVYQKIIDRINGRKF